MNVRARNTRHDGVPGRSRARVGAIVAFGTVLGTALVTSGPEARAAAPGATNTAPATDARAGAIGLLALPEVFGTEPCARFQPRPVPVFAQPGVNVATHGGTVGADAPDGGSLLGEIRTTSPWRYPAEGGCEGLRVDFVAVDGAAAELPSQEYAAEQPAAIVLAAARDDWYRVRLPAGEGWVHARGQDEYVPLLALLERDALLFTGAPELRVAPAADAALVTGAMASCAAPRVVSTAGEGEHRWVEVELVRDECCAGGPAESDTTPPSAAVRGWLPLRRGDGVPSLWFAARGC